MVHCTIVFETLKGFFPMNILEKAIEETGADHRTKKFTVLRQLNAMMYAHLTQKDSLRHKIHEHKYIRSLKPLPLFSKLPLKLTPNPRCQR